MSWRIFSLSFSSDLEGGGLKWGGCFSSRVFLI